MIIDKYRYFLFDIDRTLWDFDVNAAIALKRTLFKFDLPIDDLELFVDRYEAVNRNLWNQYESGKITKEYLRTQRFYKTLKNDYGIDDLLLSEKIGLDYLEQMALGNSLVQGALDVLDEIYSKGGKMAVISNGFKEVQYRKMKVSGIDKYFDVVIISDEVGVNKPHPRIFDIAVKKLGANKKETLMVGDDFINDIEGAQIYGIDQFYFNPRHLPCDGGPTYHSDNMYDLIK